ncbi:hypothetical protein OCAE111667_05150 [Occultella aeris]|uniref:Uncharacterized protein n=1 Tax=Occultella aeris TaxID=2761496 RepID=A0A7M4DM83_9MICO|nr:hypothetical protein HALOF300_03251 [Occultella aeris]
MQTLGAVQPVGVGEDPHPAAGVDVGERRVAPLGRAHRGPVQQRGGDIEEAGGGPGHVEVDQRHRLALGEDDVLDGDVVVPDHVGGIEDARDAVELDALGPGDAVGQWHVDRDVMETALQDGQVDQDVLGHRPAVHGPPAHLTVDEGDHLATCRIDAEEPGSPVETDRLQMRQIGLDGGAVGPAGSAHRGTLADQPVADVAAEQRHLALPGGTEVRRAHRRRRRSSTLVYPAMPWRTTLSRRVSAVGVTRVASEIGSSDPTTARRCENVSNPALPW